MDFLPKSSIHKESSQNSELKIQNWEFLLCSGFCVLCSSLTSNKVEWTLV
jgi:hypothetical protein